LGSTRRASSLYSQCTFTISDIDEVAETAPASRKGHKKGAFEDAVEFLQAPVEEVTVDRAWEMLGFIPSDLGYMDWLNVALGLRHQFYGRQEEEGYKLFDDWSSGGDKYAGEKETRKKWESCHPHAPDRAPVTVRTVIKMARENGWDASETKKAVRERINRFILSEPDPDKLMDHGIIEIARAPLLEAMDHDTFLSSLQDSLKNKGQKVGLPSLRKALKAARAKLFVPDKNEVPNWGKNLVFIESTDQFYHTVTGAEWDVRAFDRANRRNLQDDSELMPSGVLLDKVQIPTVYNTIYDPKEEASIVTTATGDGGVIQQFVNTYVPSYAKPKPRKAKEAERLFREHLSNIIREPQWHEVIINWMAYQVQHPVISRALASAIGETNVKEATGHSLIGSSFTDWAEGAQLVVFEEIRMAGKNRFEVMDKLKPAVTNSRISVSIKFKSSQTIANVSNYVLFSNHHDALALAPDDRRYFVLKCIQQTEEQVDAINSKLDGQYFSEMFRLAPEGDLAGGMRSFLEDYEIPSSFDPKGRPPKTRYFYEMLGMSHGDEEIFILETISDPEHRRIGRMLIDFSHLANLMGLEDGLRVSKKTLAATLARLNYYSSGCFTIDGKRQTWYVSRAIPENEAREAVKDLVLNEFSQADIAECY